MREKGLSRIDRLPTSLPPPSWLVFFPPSLHLLLCQKVGRGAAARLRRREKKLARIDRSCHQHPLLPPWNSSSGSSSSSQRRRGPLSPPPLSLPLPPPRLVSFPPSLHLLLCQKVGRGSAARLRRREKKLARIDRSCHQHPLLPPWNSSSGSSSSSQRRRGPLSPPPLSLPLPPPRLVSFPPSLHLLLCQKVGRGAREKGLARIDRSCHHHPLSGSRRRRGPLSPPPLSLPLLYSSLPPPRLVSFPPSLHILLCQKVGRGAAARLRKVGEGTRRKMILWQKPL